MLYALLASGSTSTPAAILSDLDDDLNRTRPGDASDIFAFDSGDEPDADLGDVSEDIDSDNDDVETAASPEVDNIAETLDTAFAEEFLEKAAGGANVAVCLIDESMLRALSTSGWTVDTPFDIEAYL